MNFPHEEAFGGSIITPTFVNLGAFDGTTDYRGRSGATTTTLAFTQTTAPASTYDPVTSTGAPTSFDVELSASGQVHGPSRFGGQEWDYWAAPGVVEGPDTITANVSLGCDYGWFPYLPG